MPTIHANGIDIFYEQWGNPADPALILVCGLGAQVVTWDDAFIQALVSRGYFVTSWDNRDVGLSTWFTAAGLPTPEGILGGTESAPYLLSDMAADAAAVVEGLKLGPVHVVGVSMGGMIAQQFAIDFPALTRTLTSIMSTPAAMSVGAPTPEILGMMLTPRSADLATFLEEELESWKKTSGDYEPNAVWVRRQAELSWARGRNPEGVMRQMAAIVQSPDRRPGLSTLTMPVLVMHGDADPLVTPSGGEATAGAVAHCRYVVFPGMGHSLPQELWSAVFDEIDAVTLQA